MLKKIIYIVVGFFSFVIILSVLFATDSPAVNTNTQSSEVKTTKQVEQAEVIIDDSTKEEKKVVEKTSPTNTEITKPSSTYYLVTSVVDGDTLKININGTTETLRLIGIDTPETVDPRKPVQCFGLEASNKAKELLNGKKVRIEKDPSQGERDKYDRLLVYVYREDGLFFNKYMIEQGYAYEYTYNTPYKYQTEFKSAQQLAKTKQIGLWSPNTCNGDSTPPQSNTTNQTAGKFYTSSHHSAKYYYPESCSAWEGLSSTYLRSFNTLDELLVSYSRTKSPQCD